MAAAMAPVATANSSPAAAPSSSVMAVMAAMPATMGDLLYLYLDPVIPFEDSRIRLVQFIENSIALGNTGNRAAGSGYSSKRHSPRNA
ncbi:hypothetical protein DBIPINDM_001416 [Mesorhizobium sp. AR02]|uniref:hypothetical protein n=1 Tax=Mesorhizobium sp. AR02 TaxID=2865837 RepID=UPI00215FCDED|nr:hypothetical protein [Mesorhizobium sp. AR02]UVK54936.1 hypothetical protein DBIPINDM_001416 [Mesorhizobium sp. AR02]